MIAPVATRASGGGMLGDYGISDDDATSLYLLI